MGEYHLKPDPAAFRVDAVRWHKDGDHPDVRKIYGAGDMVDDLCGHPSHAHGFLKTPDGTVGVCPGDWIVRKANGELWRLRPAEFESAYQQKTGSKP